MPYCNSPECKGAEVEVRVEQSDNGHDDHTFQAFHIPACIECGSEDFLFSDIACAMPYEYEGHVPLDEDFD